MRGEKRTGRLEVPKQLRCGHGLGAVIRFLASMNNRPASLELIELATKGLEQHCRETGKEVSELFRQVLAGNGR